MNKAVKRQKVIDKQRVDPKEAWKVSLKKKRRQKAIWALSVLAPLALVCILWLLHSLGILRIGTPGPLSRALAQPQSTTELVLDNSYLKVLPPEIGTLSALRILSMSGNELAVLPDQIGELLSLEILRLDYNLLGSLPKTVGQLSKLVELNLKNNRLKGLPEEISGLSSLKSLDLANNQLTLLPRELGKLRSMEVLSLRNNRLTTLPDSVTSLTSLTLLDLENNPIDSLPDLAPLQELRRVNLKGTKISEEYVKVLRETLPKASVIR